MPKYRIQIKADILTESYKEEALRIKYAEVYRLIVQHFGTKGHVESVIEELEVTKEQANVIDDTEEFISPGPLVSSTDSDLEIRGL